MKIDLYELKFLITDAFYTNATINKYSFEQVSSMCYEMFGKYINANAIEGVIAISTIISLKMTHNVTITEYDIQQMNRFIELIKIIPIDILLDGDEYEYLKICLEEDIDSIKYRYNKLVN